MDDWVEWEGLTDDERLQLMLKVHFLRWGNIEGFIDKLRCQDCYDYGKVRLGFQNRQSRIVRDCRGKRLSGQDVIKCMKEQAREKIYTIYMPNGKREGGI
jgi:hypothetical protein